MGRNWIEIKLNLEEETTNFLCNDNESLNEEKKFTLSGPPLHFPPSHPVHAYRSNRALFFFLLLPPVSFSYPFSFFPFLPRILIG